MGLLSVFTKARPRLLRLSSGSFTVDSNGQVLTSTLPHTFPEELVLAIGEAVLETFRTARESQLPFAELMVRYANLKITAHELRGGAIIFVAPQTLMPTHPQN